MKLRALATSAILVLITATPTLAESCAECTAREWQKARGTKKAVTQGLGWAGIAAVCTAGTAPFIAACTGFTGLGAGTLSALDSLYAIEGACEDICNREAAARPPKPSLHPQRSIDGRPRVPTFVAPPPTVVWPSPIITIGPKRTRRPPETRPPRSAATPKDCHERKDGSGGLHCTTDSSNTAALPRPTMLPKTPGQASRRLRAPAGLGDAKPRRAATDRASRRSAKPNRTGHIRNGQRSGRRQPAQIRRGANLPRAMRTQRATPRRALLGQRRNVRPAVRGRAGGQHFGRGSRNPKRRLR